MVYITCVIAPIRINIVLRERARGKEECNPSYQTNSTKNKTRKKNTNWVNYAKVLTSLCSFPHLFIHQMATRQGEA